MILICLQKFPSIIKLVPAYYIISLIYALKKSIFADERDSGSILDGLMELTSALVLRTSQSQCRPSYRPKDTECRQVWLRTHLSKKIGGTGYQQYREMSLLRLVAFDLSETMKHTTLIY